MKKSIILCLSILMIAITGCKKNENSWGKLAEGSITINVGETKKLTFTSDGNVKPQWVSEDETIATVDAEGNVTGVRVGSVYVTVNGLQCKVTVIDNYMTVVEPYQNWLGNYDDVESYMIKNYGNVTIPELEYDTIELIEKIKLDTVYVPGTDPAEIDTIIADTTFRKVSYVTMATFTYEASLEGQFVDEYTYIFDFDEETEESYLVVATMTVNAAHVGEIEKFLNNRYVETKGSKGHYRYANEWGYYTYIKNANPEIVYSASKIEE